MKKTLLVTGIAALMLMVGCSKQPKIENAALTNTTPTQTEKQTSETSMMQPTGVQESVSTQNATLEEETITNENQVPTSVTVTQQNQKFAKKLASIVVYFDFDKYNIRPDQWPKVEKLAELIKQNPSNYTVRIEGNCDEWGTEEYNYALGLKRANSVKNALIKLGVDPKKLTVISYGELNPVCTAHAKWCWRLNRRDNFTYLP